jgi:hypothetical protein
MRSEKQPSGQGEFFEAAPIPYRHLPYVGLETETLEFADGFVLE